MAKSENFIQILYFGFKKNDAQKILFIDPKGTTNSEYQLKIDGFDEIFRDKIWPKDGLKLSVDLKMIKSQNEDISKGYANYWIYLQNLQNAF